MKRRLALLALSIAMPAQAETLQDRLLSGARAASPEAVAFTRTARVEQRSGGGASEVKTRVERYDPSRPPAQRWTLVSVDGRAPTAEEATGAAKQGAEAPVPGYYRLARWVGAKAACDARTCRYATLPKDTLVINGHDLSADTAAEVTAGGGATPYVERTHFLSLKGFRLMLVAKVERVEATSTYKLLPGGVPVVVQSEIVLTGSMMGKSGTSRTTTTYSDWRVVSPTR